MATAPVGLFNAIEDDVITLFNETWAHLSVPVLWRTNDLEPLPDPATTRYFLRNSVLFGIEITETFGDGPGLNEKYIFGAVEFVGFATRSVVSEHQLLEILWDATHTLRSKKVVGSYAGGSDLSFETSGATFDINAQETGNWFLRGVRVDFEYRFVG